MDLDILIFECAGIRFGLPASEVSGVVRAVQVTPIPRAPPELLGVISLRGELVAVIDARLRLGLAGAAVNPSHQFIVVRLQDDRFALHVDRAIDVISTRPEQPSDSVRGELPRDLDQQMIRFVTKTDQLLVPVLEPDRIATPELLRAIGSVRSATATETDPSWRF